MYIKSTLHSLLIIIAYFQGSSLYTILDTGSTTIIDKNRQK